MIVQCLSPYAMYLRRQPLWAIPIHIAVSLALGTALTLFLEEPARKQLRLVKSFDSNNLVNKFTIELLIQIILGS